MFKYFKRPLFAAAVLICLISFILAVFFAGRIIDDSMEDGEDCTVTGEICKVEEKEYSVYVYVKPAGERRQVLLTASKSSGFSADEFIPGNTISASCTYAEFNSARNFGNYDEKKYYRSLGIFYKYKIKSYYVTDDAVDRISVCLSSIRSALIGSINDLVPDEETAGILIAICTGSKSSLGDESKDLYRSSGISHILAISGLHISFLGMGLYRLLRRKLRFSISAGASFGVVLAFCFMSGASASSVRAVIMFAVHLGAMALGKKYDVLNALSLSAIMLLLYEPFYITNTGFIFSFISVLSIPLAADTVRKFLGSDNNLITGAVITASILPVVIRIYFEFPLYSVLINLIVVPLAAYILLSGLAGAVFGMISLFLGRFAIASGVFLLQFIEILCRITAYLPLSSVLTGMLSDLAAAAYYAALLGAVFIMKFCIRRKKQKLPVRIHPAVFLGITAALLIFIAVFRTDPDELVISAIDVDQGECILVTSPSGYVYMLDMGSTSVDEVYDYRVESALKYKGIDRIDHLFISHADTDHISGVLEMLENGADIEIGCILMPEIGDNENYDEIYLAAQEAGIDVITLHSGMVLDDGEIVITCLHPDTSYTCDDINGYSAVLSLVYGDFKALLTGDLLIDGEELLIDSGTLEEDYDLYTAAHHGSKNSNSLEFIETITPDIVLISAGVDNSYGHPHAETLERFESVGAEIYVTAELGEIDVRISADGEININTMLAE